MKKREIAAKLLGAAAAQPLWRRLLPQRESGLRALRILAYHRVLGSQSSVCPFNEDLISAHSETFRRQMEFARKNFDVLSFKDLHECEQGGRLLPPRPLIVTFDDGYRDNYVNAFPVLKSLGVPATIFLVTAHIGQKKLFWWDLIAYCVKQTKRERVCLPAIGSFDFELGSLRQRRQTIETILRWVKRAPEKSKNELLKDLATIFDVEVPDSVVTGLHLSWSEVREMAAQGVDFGSHTVSHPILTNVGEDQLKTELAESKRAIESNTGQEVLALAYPVGDKETINTSVKECTAKAGFRYAVSYEDAPDLDGVIDRYEMPRIHVENDQSMSLFRANLLFPGVMFNRGDSRLIAFGRMLMRKNNARVFATAHGRSGS